VSAHEGAGRAVKGSAARAERGDEPSLRPSKAPRTTLGLSSLVNMGAGGHTDRAQQRPRWSATSRARSWSFSVMQAPGKTQEEPR
jgi:hypothetical protein